MRTIMIVLLALFCMGSSCNDHPYQTPNLTQIESETVWEHEGLILHDKYGGGDEVCHLGFYECFSGWVNGSRPYEAPVWEGARESVLDLYLGSIVIDYVDGLGWLTRVHGDFYLDRHSADCFNDPDLQTQYPVNLLFVGNRLSDSSIDMPDFVTIEGYRDIDSGLFYFQIETSCSVPSLQYMTHALWPIPEGTE